jgi:hypothetical protein
MRYVVVIEKEDGAPNYKVYNHSSDAVKRHDRASQIMNSKRPAGSLVTLGCLSARPLSPARKEIQMKTEQKSDPADTRLEKEKNIELTDKELGKATGGSFQWGVGRGIGSAMSGSSSKG